jgi:hypothetical protein
MAGKTTTPDWNALVLKVPREPVLVTVPTMKYLAADGKGDPAISPDFRDAVGALYGLAYTMKFMLKARGVTESVPMPLEGLFWADDMSAFMKARRGEWQWTLMLLQPSAVDAKLLKEARVKLEKKRKGAKLPAVRLVRFAEGPCAQVLHLGPYAEEKSTIQRLHRFISEQGYELTGRHHEIYLSQPGRGDPAKMKTVIRQPVARGRAKTTKKASRRAKRTPQSRTRRPSS